MLMPILLLDHRPDGFSLPVCIEHTLTHFKQRYTWDCGISCILMILPIDRKVSFLERFMTICNEEGFDKSTWTIDLCYLLKRFEIKHIYCTITCGINPGYHEESFYEKILCKDESRVIERFKAASSIGINIKVKRITTYDLLDHLYKFGSVILLINANLLHCDICKTNKLATELRSCFPWKISYCGHYIVLCGYNLKTSKFLYRNPSFKNRICTTSFKYLDEARMSYGTDDDAIFIFNK